MNTNLHHGEEELAVLGEEDPGAVDLETEHVEDGDDPVLVYGQVVDEVSVPVLVPSGGGQCDDL